LRIANIPHAGEACCLQQGVLVLVDRETQDAPEIHMREVGRAHAAQPVVFDAQPLRRHASTVACRCVFQAITRFVSRVSDPEIAIISS
jgi:hypothetical protein